MSRVRVVAGLLVGLALGLLVVGLSATSQFQTSSGSLAASKAPAGTASSYTVPLAQPGGSPNSTIPYASVTATETATASSTATSQGSPAYATISSPSPRSPVSNVDDLPKQSPLTNTLVLLPVVIAAALGVTVYRAAKRSEPAGET